MSAPFFWTCMVSAVLVFAVANKEQSVSAWGFMGILVVVAIVTHYVERRIIDAESEDT